MYSKKEIKVDLSINHIKQLVVDHSEQQIIKARDAQQTSSKARKSAKQAD